MSHDRRGDLRVGDWVQVLSPQEILATLDADGLLDGLPFMPEMLAFCGKRYQVYKSAHKTCDTISSYAIRRMANAVHLADLRCDGAAHGGCQAGCLIFWKTNWLKRVDARGAHENTTVTSPVAAGPSLESEAAWHTLSRTVHQPPVEGQTEEHFRCQATEVVRATTEVRRRGRWNPMLYVQDVTSGNVTVGELVTYGLKAMVTSFTLYWFGWRQPRLCGVSGKPTPTLNLNLQPGDLVQVRSKDEIMKTVNADMRNRGLLYDVEQVRFCEAGEFRVLKRVDRIIDEKTGRMAWLKNPNIILDGVTCSGNISSSRMFCPRAIYPYWREIWLERTGPPQDSPGSTASAPR